MINSVVYNQDCMEGMRQYPDKYFDLAVCDPPYGINADKKNSNNILQSNKSACLSKYYGSQKWDNNIPNLEYFNELFRISKNQIIWGANYYGLIGGYIFWDKNVTMPTYSDGELAYCSLQNNIKKIKITWHRMLQANMKNKEIRIHPTQKPIKLYEWIYKNYAKEGQKIIDTHGGSMSNVIAALNYGMEITCYEIDKDYYNAAKLRIQNYLKQGNLFKEIPNIKFVDNF